MIASTPKGLAAFGTRSAHGGLETEFAEAGERDGPAQLMIVLRHDGDSEGHITGRHSEDPRA